MFLREYPNFEDAPRGLRFLYNGCGPLVTWTVLQYFGMTVPARRIKTECRYTVAGTYTIGLAVGLHRLGLRVAFFTDRDREVPAAEKRLFSLAQGCGVPIRKALSLPKILARISERSIPVVYYLERGVEHFSPLLGTKRSRLVLPMSSLPPPTPAEFEARWRTSATCRQCIFVGTSRGVPGGSTRSD